MAPLVGTLDRLVWVGIGRDMDGNVIFIFSVHKGVHSNNMMEALSIKLAMERACSLGWRRMVCESDS